MRLFVNISTVGSKVDPSNYPPGDYALNIIDQRSSHSADPDEFSVSTNWFSIDSIGLSRSRNAGLDIVTSEDECAVVLIGDNDVRYISGADRIVTGAYERHPDADIVLFKVRTPEGADFKNYPTTRRWYGLRSIMKACSIEMSFRVSAIKAAGIRFDERFGLGSVYKTGEEIIFLADALRAGLKILYVPAAICIHKAESSGEALSSENIYAKGVMFRRIFGVLGLVAIVGYVLKKSRSKSKGLTGRLIVGVRGALDGPRGPCP